MLNMLIFFSRLLKSLLTFINNLSTNSLLLIIKIENEFKNYLLLFINALKDLLKKSKQISLF